MALYGQHQCTTLCGWAGVCFGVSLSPPMHTTPEIQHPFPFPCAGSRNRYRTNKKNISCGTMLKCRTNWKESKFWRICSAINPTVLCENFLLNILGWFSMYLPSHARQSSILWYLRGRAWVSNPMIIFIKLESIRSYCLSVSTTLIK